MRTTTTNHFKFLLYIHQDAGLQESHQQLRDKLDNPFTRQQNPSDSNPNKWMTKMGLFSSIPSQLCSLSRTPRTVNVNCLTGSVMIVPGRKTILFFLKIKKEMGKTFELSNYVNIQGITYP